MMILFILFTISLYFTTILVKNKLNLSAFFSSSILFLFCLLTYLLAILTKNITLTNTIVLIFFGIISVTSIIGCLLTYKTNLKELFNQLKPYFCSMGISLVLFAFSNLAIRDLITLMPLSDSANQLSVVQNVYYGTNLIAIDRTVNTFALFFSNILRLIKGFSSSQVVTAYINLTTLSLFFLLSDMLINIWISNNCKNRILNNGVILFIGSLFSYTLFKFSYLSYLWIIFPMSTYLVYLLNDHEKLDYLLMGLSLASLFVVGIDFKLAFLLFGVLLFLFCINLIVQKISDKLGFIVLFVLNVCLIIFSLGSFIINNKYINFDFKNYLIPNSSNIFFSCFDYSNSNYLIAIILICIFVRNLIRVKKITFIEFTILTVLLVCLNPLILSNIQIIKNYQVFLLLFFNPVIYCYVFNKSNIKFEKSLVVSGAVVMMAVSNQLMVNPYYTNDSFKYDVNSRIEKDEFEINEYLFKQDFSEENKIISQAPFTKAFLPNVTLLEGYVELMERCQYCDVISDNLHAPSELINIFSYREYSENQLFIEEPNYSNALSFVIEGNYRYLILRNNQIIKFNGNWVPLANLFVSNYDTLISNETYTLMGIKNLNSN